MGIMARNRIKALRKERGMSQEQFPKNGGDLLSSDVLPYSTPPPRLFPSKVERDASYGR